MIQRYFSFSNVRCAKDLDGDWIRHSDHLRAMAEMEEENKRLREAAKRLICEARPWAEHGTLLDCMTNRACLGNAIHGVEDALRSIAAKKTGGGK